MIRDLVLVASFAGAFVIGSCSNGKLVLDKQVSDCKRMKIFTETNGRKKIEVYDTCGLNPNVPILVQNYDGEIFADSRIYEHYISRN